MEKDKICNNCKHFRQHYVKFGRSYRQILHGHCVYPRLKNRETTSKACDHYSQRE